MASNRGNRGTATGATGLAVAASFACWHNTEHLHSGTRYVTPEQRHSGEALAILVAREAPYRPARQANPARCSRHTPNWTLAPAVSLNPERKAEAIPKGHQRLPLAA